MQAYQAYQAYQFEHDVPATHRVAFELPAILDRAFKGEL